MTDLLPTALKETLKESLRSVLPIAGLTAILCLFIAPMPADTLLSFALGTGFIIVGLGLFTYGADRSMTRMGNYIGAKLTETRKVFPILILNLLLGALVTIAEPDLQVLAGNTPHIRSAVLIGTVAVGVGLFLMLSMIRILFGIPLNRLLLIFYVLLIILGCTADPRYLSVAFDSGGVTTGPMTAPFIISLGVGVASIRSDRRAEDDSFGLVALCSIGPILAVLILSFIYPGESGEIAAAIVTRYEDSVQLGTAYLSALPRFMAEVAVALLPVIGFFALFQLFVLKLPRLPLLRILGGLIYTYAGLVLFLAGVQLGFSSLGLLLGRELAQGATRVFLIPLAMLMGYFVVSAEPAVHVLTKQVEEISAGAISQKAMQYSLAVAIAAALGLSALRAMIGFSILYVLVPGYCLALILSFISPKIYTAIAFDSGGVASGPMSATFMLPFMIGICQASGGSILTDAFGVVALVSLMPLISIQVLGIMAARREKTAPEPVTPSPQLEILELW